VAATKSGKLIPYIPVDDHVLFGKWSGTEVKIDGQEPIDQEGELHYGVLTNAAGSKQEAYR
jgi:chaperonin GroES